MSKKEEFKKELILTTAIWAFLVAGGATFFGLRYFLKTRNEEPAAEETSEASEGEKKEEAGEESESEEKPAEEEKLAEPTIGPSPFAGAPALDNGTNSTSTYNAVKHNIDGVNYIYYKTLVWGTVVADFGDFRAKVRETLSDVRGWTRLGVQFVEVTEGQDLNIVLSEPSWLEGYNGYCSSSLSCTSGLNEVIINDERWREGTAETISGGMSQRDYQHMVLNHEVGHWLGHYEHIEACDVYGGQAPIMLQQSTGLRNCGSFNPWPLDSELWTLR